MSAIATELENVLTRLDVESAKRLEDRVRAAISEASKREAKMPTLEELKRRRPELAEFIGSLADVEFELPPDLPLPPAKIW